MTHDEHRAIHPKYFYVPISESSNAAVENSRGKKRTCAEDFFKIQCGSAFSFLVNLVRPFTYSYHSVVRLEAYQPVLSANSLPDFFGYAYAPFFELMLLR